jgi:hypothetical protein
MVVGRLLPMCAAALALTHAAGAVGALRAQQSTHERPFDVRHDLVVSMTPHDGRASSLRVSLRDRLNPAQIWELLAKETSVESVDVVRVDTTSVVLCEREHYGYELGCVKLFIDVDAHRVTKAIDFKRDHPLEFASVATGRQTLGVSDAEWQMLKSHGAFTLTYATTAELPSTFTAHPMPNSSYQDFANARPRRVRDGYREGDTKINESAAAWQRVDGGIWFGKTFYDGEGSSGVGDVGFLSSDGQYTWLRLSEMADWSASALLLESSTIWVARVNKGEGELLSGGLLEYDRRTRVVRVHECRDLIHSIVHLGTSIFLGTRHGLDVLRDGALTGYRMEPDVTGRFVVVTDRQK